MVSVIFIDFQLFYILTRIIPTCIYKMCPAVTLSHQDGRHSAVALLLKAALIQVSDYRLLGDSGFYFELIVPILEEDHPMTIPSKVGFN
jgi:hypothetical protein